MKAIIFNHYGSVDDLHYQEVPTPIPSSTQVLVKIYATTVNHIDIGIAAGIFKDFAPLSFPWIPGYDFAGVIEMVGDEVQGFKKGDEVYGLTLHGGTYAEYIAVDPGIIALKPPSLDFLQAASVPVSAETASQVLFQHAGIKKGQTILIHGGAGALGTYAVQMAHQAGAKVIVTASSGDKALLTGLGADTVLDYKGTSFESLVSGVDAVIDLVGGDIQKRSYPVIKEGGVLISVNQPVSEELAAKYKVRAIFAQLQSSGPLLEQITGAINAGDLKVYMGNVFPLAKTAEAWEALGAKRSKGRIVLQVQ
jgi:NADPH:quinone reductase-like Zn-dependent oxidoreductase